MNNTKNVALVLGSGGARGLAHIGAIEELVERGYTITSIAGTSMGAMIAGMYAAGKLQEAKEWFLQVDKQTIVQMVDLSISLNSIVKGEKIIKELEKVVPDCLLQDLPIPCTIVSADLISADEVLFKTGSLFNAIRASISIPLFFQPVQKGQKLLVDGGILNPLPLNRVKRHKGDLLVAVNISGKDSMEIKKSQTKSGLLRATEWIQEYDKLLPAQLQSLGARIRKREIEKSNNLTDSVNYISMVDRMLDMQIQQNTRLTLQLTQPDILAEMPQYAFTTFDFDKAGVIMERGRQLMHDALDQYEQSKK